MQIIEKELNNVKKELEKSFASPIPNNVLKDFVLSGSKYIRSILSILYLKSQKYEITEDIYKILCAGELIHNSSLLHDDVIDNAETRRGRTVIAKEFSSKISILAGDYLLSITMEKLLELGPVELLKKFQACAKKMIKSEIEQFFLRGEKTTLDEYIEICKGKTASLFSVILESCAFFAGAETAKAKQFGEIFGLCFQINNDLNKDSANLDYKNGIYTAKDILGIEKTTYLLDNYKEEMSKLIKDIPENIYKEKLEDLIKSL